MSRAVLKSPPLSSAPRHWWWPACSSTASTTSSSPTHRPTLRLVYPSLGEISVTVGLFHPGPPHRAAVMIFPVISLPDHGTPPGQVLHPRMTPGQTLRGVGRNPLGRRRVGPAAGRRGRPPPRIAAPAIPTTGRPGHAPPWPPPRLSEREPSIEMAGTIAQNQNKHGPVRFDHKKHAEMAQMGEGCYGCHHFNQSADISCKECHSVSRARTTCQTDLNAARHRLCLDCHSAGTETACASVMRKAEEGNQNTQAKKTFPKAVVPERVVFKTPSAIGKTVVFLHRSHAADFGFKCADCHREQSCASCHGADPQARAPSSVGRHRACFSCHGKDDCAKCHHVP